MFSDKTIEIYCNFNIVAYILSPSFFVIAKANSTIFYDIDDYANCANYYSNAHY